MTFAFVCNVTRYEGNMLCKTYSISTSYVPTVSFLTHKLKHKTCKLVSHHIPHSHGS